MVAVAALSISVASSQPTLLTLNDSSSSTRCAGDEPVWWSPTSACKDAPAPCVSGDTQLALLDQAVVRCGPRGASFRYFNHSMSRTCLDRIAQQQPVRTMMGSTHHISRARILVVGVSNTRHIWHAMGADDVFEDILVTLKQCNWCRENELKAFLPHQIHYAHWMTASLGVQVKGPSARGAFHTCFPKGALGGSPKYKTPLHWVTRHESVPYHVVGAWDKAFTSRNNSAFAAGIQAAVEHVAAQWPLARQILIEMTGCGGRLPREARNGSSGQTPRAACAWVRTANAILHEIAQRNRVGFLSAYQMTRSRPGINVSGYPPGLWTDEHVGIHFAITESKRLRQVARAKNPPSAAGEMPRAIANRLWGMICDE
jgi:hypothetical protein